MKMKCMDDVLMLCVAVTVSRKSLGFGVGENPKCDVYVMRKPSTGEKGTLKRKALSFSSTGRLHRPIGLHGRIFKVQFAKYPWKALIVIYTMMPFLACFEITIKNGFKNNFLVYVDEKPLAAKG